VIDEAYDVLNDMKNKDTLNSPHGNGLCDPKKLLEAFKEIAQHLALGTVAIILLNRNVAGNSALSPCSIFLILFLCSAGEVCVIL
jgi:hypothetical protein